MRVAAVLVAPVFLLAACEWAVARAIRPATHEGCKEELNL